MYCSFICLLMFLKLTHIPFLRRKQMVESGKREEKRLFILVIQTKTLEETCEKMKCNWRINKVLFIVEIFMNTVFNSGHAYWRKFNRKFRVRIRGHMTIKNACHTKEKQQKLFIINWYQILSITWLDKI